LRQQREQAGARRTANRTVSATFPGSAPTIANSTSPIDGMSSLTL